MMASEINDPPAVPPPVDVTVSVAEPATAPAMLAEIVAVPALTAVVSPVELTAATPELLDDQVTWSVTFEEEDGWLP